MKANDLRIGNYIEAFGKLSKVVAICETRVQVRNVEDNKLVRNWIPFNSEQLKPIISADLITIDLGANQPIPEELHKLQNLVFALTGHELDLTFEKIKE